MEALRLLIIQSRRGAGATGPAAARGGGGADVAGGEAGQPGDGDDGSGVVPTAWALLGLMAGRCADEAAVKRGVAYLERRQLESGDWPQEGIAGVFNRACGITYTAYRNVFPIWALARYREEYLRAS